MKNQTMKKNVKPLAIALGSSLAISLSSVGIANATPFGVEKLQSGYMLADLSGEVSMGDRSKDKQADGKCSEAKCSANGGTKKGSEAKCSANK